LRASRREGWVENERGSPGMSLDSVHDGDADTLPHYELRAYTTPGITRHEPKKRRPAFAGRLSENVPGWRQTGPHCEPRIREPISHVRRLQTLLQRLATPPGAQGVEER